MKTIDKFKKKVKEYCKEFQDLKIENNISVKHRINQDDKTLIVNFTIINKATEWTRGVFNGTDDGKYIFFLDYDYMKLDYIEGELKHLQTLFDLGDIHLFQSSEKGFHAVSFAKLHARDYMDILEGSMCDQAFAYTPRFVSYRNWVLRNFPKGKKQRPKYLNTIYAKTHRKQSNAHWKYFSLLYPNIKKNKLTNSDGLEKIRIVDYPTGMNV
jgi:hypothetical protein|tara:strand:+ start:4288 stop:4923 length:636 start_codon:yes stop_codon:yes gene_type:complete